MATQALVLVNQDSPRSESDGNFTRLKGTKRGEACVVDFYVEMALEQRGFQVRDGVLSAPITSDIPLVDELAEMATNPGTGITILPCELVIATGLAPGTLHEYAAKSRPLTVAVTGTAFTALPMYLGGVAAQSQSFVSGAGGVDVGAGEDVTLDRMHWHFAHPLAMGAWDTPAPWLPIAPPVIAGDSIFYVQIGATGTATSHFTHYNFIELRTANID